MKTKILFLFVMLFSLSFAAFAETKVYKSGTIFVSEKNYYSLNLKDLDEDVIDFFDIKGKEAISFLQYEVNLIKKGFYSIVLQKGKMEDLEEEKTIYYQILENGKSIAYGALAPQAYFTEIERELEILGESNLKVRIFEIDNFISDFDGVLFFKEK